MVLKVCVVRLKQEVIDNATVPLPLRKEAKNWLGLHCMPAKQVWYRLYFSKLIAAKYYPHSSKLSELSTLNLTAVGICLLPLIHTEFKITADNNDLDITKRFAIMVLYLKRWEGNK